jgi:hypothetical protein
VNSRAVGPPDVNGGLRSQPEGAGLDELLGLWSGKRRIPGRRDLPGAEQAGQLDPQSLALQSVGVLIGSPSLFAGKLPWSATSHHSMKSRIVSDGESRLRSSPEFQARLRELRESIRARHAAEFAAAGFFRRFVLRWRMATEFRAERRKIEPSPGSLYSSQIAARRV